MPLLGINRYTAIIPYVLVRTRSDVEKRCFSAIGVSDQSYVYYFARAVGCFLHANVFIDNNIGRFDGKYVFCLFCGYDLDESGFAAPQRNFVIENFVFYRVF